MAKLTLNEIANVETSEGALNTNFDLIEAELQNKVLYRNNPVGEPNAMEVDLDLNGKRILNLPAPVDPSEPARLRDLQEWDIGAIGTPSGAALVGFMPTAGNAATDVQQALVNVEAMVDAIEPTTTLPASSITYDLSASGSQVTNVDKKLKQSVSAFDFMTSAQIADVQANTALVDVTAPLNAAITYLVSVGGGELFCPRGTYLLSGVAGADTYKNGVLLPDTNGDFSTSKGITIVGEGTSTVLKAGSTNMIVVRSSRLYSGVKNLKIDGAGLANVIGAALAPESLTQTTELVSQSFQNWQQVYIENCTEGMLMQPGPTVTGADSGGFYHNIDRCIFNLNTRHIWLKKDVTAANNRTTRTVFRNCILTRGNTGVQIDGGTEIDFISCQGEMIASGTSPNTTPVYLFYNDTNPSIINLIGGYAEACTIAVKAVSDNAASYVHLFGFEHDSPPDASQSLMPVHVTNRIRIAKNANNPIYLEFGNNGFVNLTADPDGTNSKTLALKINGSDKERWTASGSKTFYGSIGNITYNAQGNGIEFSRNGNNYIGAQGGASGQLTYYGLQHVFANVAGTSMYSADSSYFYSNSDNSRSLGLSGFRWSSVWAATGTIQTSDPRTKKDIQDSSLGLDFIMKLRPVSYRFKVGGNKIIGDREVKPAVLDEDGNVLEPAVMEPILEPQPGKRLHYGFLTTDVKAALDSCGVEDFGGYVKTNPDDPESEEALRYDEFISPLVKAVQELTERIKVLESRI